MTLAKKKRIRAKQIGRNKRTFEAMSNEQIERAFERVQSAVKNWWKKRGFNFNTTRYE